MQIKVKSILGKEYVVQIENDYKVSQIKQLIFEQSNGQVPIERQKLVYKGRALQDSSPISEYNLENNCKVNLIVQKDNTSVNTTNLSTASHSTSTTNTCGNTTNTRYNMSRFEKLLKERLSRHCCFSPEEIDRIMSKLHQEIDLDVNSSSLDDLERLAKQKLNITNE